MATSRIQATTATYTYVQAINGITGGLRLYKDFKSKTVRAYGYFRRNTDIGFTTPIFNVPEEYRPQSNWEIPMMLSTDSVYGVGYKGIIESNGNISQLLGSSVREGFIAAEWSYDGR